jgi:hypothetical protein
LSTVCGAFSTTTCIASAAFVASMALASGCKLVARAWHTDACNYRFTMHATTDSLRSHDSVDMHMRCSGSPCLLQLHGTLVEVARQ